MGLETLLALVIGVEFGDSKGLLFRRVRLDTGEVLASRIFLFPSSCGDPLFSITFDLSFTSLSWTPLVSEFSEFALSASLSSPSESVNICGQQPGRVFIVPRLWNGNRGNRLFRFSRMGTPSVVCDDGINSGDNSSSSELTSTSTIWWTLSLFAGVFSSLRVLLTLITLFAFLSSRPFALALVEFGTLSTTLSRLLPACSDTRSKIYVTSRTLHHFNRPIRQDTT